MNSLSVSDKLMGKLTWEFTPQFQKYLSELPPKLAEVFEKAASGTLSGIANAILGSAYVPELMLISLDNLNGALAEATDVNILILSLSGTAKKRRTKKKKAKSRPRH